MNDSPNNLQRPRWTVRTDYAATGAGRTSTTRIGDALDSPTPKSAFATQLGDYFAPGCEAAPGVVRNQLTDLLLTTRALARVEDCGGKDDIASSLLVDLSCPNETSA